MNHHMFGLFLSHDDALEDLGHLWVADGEQHGGDAADGRRVQNVPETAQQNMLQHEPLIIVGWD